VVEAFEEVVRMLRREEAKKALIKWQEEETTVEGVEVKKDKKRSKRKCIVL